MMIWQLKFYNSQIVLANVYFVEQLLKGQAPYYSILSTISLMYAPNPGLSFLWKYDAYNGSAYCQLTIFQFLSRPL